MISSHNAVAYAGNPIQTVEPLLKAKAKERMLSGKASPVPNSAQGHKEGKVRDELAKIAGVGQVSCNPFFVSTDTLRLPKSLTDAGNRWKTRRNR